MDPLQEKNCPDKSAGHVNLDYVRDTFKILSGGMCLSVSCLIVFEVIFTSIIPMSFKVARPDATARVSDCSLPW